MQSKTNEYLEKIFTDAFKRESDSDEAIWRSLPFFAAALGLAITIIGYTIERAPAWSWSPMIVVIYVLLALMVVSFVWAFRWFWPVIKIRAYQYPPSATEISAYADALSVYHHDAETAPDQIDSSIVEDLRALMVTQLAEASTRNRENNDGKLEARSQVVLFIVIGFGLAFASEAAIFVDRLSEPSHYAGDSTDASGKETRGRARQAGRGDRKIPQADGSASQGGLGRSEALQGERDEAAREDQTMTDPKKPAAKPAAVKPDPPKPQTLKKSEGNQIGKRS